MEREGRVVDPFDFDKWVITEEDLEDLGVGDWDDDDWAAAFETATPLPKATCSRPERRTTPSKS